MSLRELDYYYGRTFKYNEPEWMRAENYDYCDDFHALCTKKHGGLKKLKKFFASLVSMVF